jgi:uncharacterized protein (TIRG00374 family)
LVSEQSAATRTTGPWLRRLLAILKVVVPAVIVVWLVWSSWPDVMKLRRHSLDFGLLGLALVLLFLAQVVTICRWHWLVRALGLRFRFREAFRLGMLAYLLNFVSLGSVGGDLFKAFFIARDQPGRRFDAVATVLADRVIGLLALMATASLAIVSIEFEDTQGHIAVLAQVVFGATVAAGVCVPLGLLLGLISHRAARFYARIPVVGGLVERVLSVMQRYARQPGVLLAAAAVSLLGQVLNCLSVYCCSQAIFVDTPTAVEHLFIVPLSDLAGALPLSPSGLGSFELAFSLLWGAAPSTTGEAAHGVATGGVVVALAHRLTQVVIAIVGAGIYLTSRREVAEALEAAEAETE